MLAGRWVRPDGGYVISIKAVDAGGKLDASQANPSPRPFYTAEATRDGSTLKLFFDLRAGGCNELFRLYSKIVAVPWWWLDG